MLVLDFLVPVEPLEAVSGLLPHVVLALVVVNVATRIRAHRSRTARADAGDESVGRSPLHVASTLLLVLVAFAYLVVEPHGGMVLSVLVLTAVVADLFEAEARAVEIRNDMPIERPKAALAASLLALLYAGYQSLFRYVQPYWDAVV